VSYYCSRPCARTAEHNKAKSASEQGRWANGVGNPPHLRVVVSEADMEDTA
jgi:hypothetical protein